MAKTLRFKSIYEFYPLYFALYGRSKHTKYYDAMTAVIALENWANANNVKKLKVLELFAGQSEHKGPMLQQLTDPNIIQRYACLDLHITDESAGVIQGDALTFDYQPFNVVLAYYYSMAATFVQDTTKQPRAQLDQFTKQVASTLKKGSCLFLHIGQLDHEGALSHPVEDEPESFPLYIGHMLLKHFGINDKPGELHVTKETWFDRYSNCTFDQLTRVELRSGGKAIANIKIESPFVQRFWTEPEIVDSLMLAGFKDIDFYHNELSYEDGPYDKLERIVKYPNSPSAHPEDDNPEANYVATELLAIK